MFGCLCIHRYRHDFKDISFRLLKCLHDPIHSRFFFHLADLVRTSYIFWKVLGVWRVCAGLRRSWALSHHPTAPMFSRLGSVIVDVQSLQTRHQTATRNNLLKRSGNVRGDKKPLLVPDCYVDFFYITLAKYYIQMCFQGLNSNDFGEKIRPHSYILSNIISYAINNSRIEIYYHFQDNFFEKTLHTLSP